MTFQALKSFIYVFAAWTLMASMAWSQNYPNKPIKIISPIPPGGAPDMIARAIGAKQAHFLTCGNRQAHTPQRLQGTMGNFEIIHPQQSHLASVAAWPR